VAAIPVDADTRTRVLNGLRHSNLLYAETFRSVGFMRGSYCRNWCSLCEALCFCVGSLTGKAEIGGSLEL
jgi:hypothetical protein